jgi:predicted transcriptional regulator
MAESEYARALKGRDAVLLELVEAQRRTIEGHQQTIEMLRATIASQEAYVTECAKQTAHLADLIEQVAAAGAGQQRSNHTSSEDR